MSGEDNTHGENYFGCDVILSPNTEAANAKKYTDTLQFNENAIENGGYDIQFYGGDAGIIDLHCWSDESYATFVKYYDYLPNKPRVVIKDPNRSYEVKADINVGTINNSGTTTNNITLVDSTADPNTTTTTIISNNKYNYTSVNSSALNYTYNGGHDIVQTGESDYTDDTYNISYFAPDSYLRIREEGGYNDVINFNYSGVNVDDIRLVFEVVQVNEQLIGARVKDRTFFVHKDALSDDDAVVEKILAANDQASLPNGANTGAIAVVDLPQVEQISSGIETIKINGIEINTEAWYDALSTRMSQILRQEKIDGGYYWGYISTAFTSQDHPASDEVKQKIINGYRDLKYSDIVQANVTSGTNVQLAENKFNRYTFSGDYDGAVVTSANAVRNGFSDTLIFSDASFDDGTLSLSLVDAGNDKRDLCISSNGKTVKYENFFTGNVSDLIIIDSNNRKMSVSENVDSLYTTTYDFGNNGAIGSYNAVFINDDGTHGYNQDVRFYAYGKSHNYIHCEGGIKLRLSQSSDECHTKVISASATNDVYDITGTGHVLVEDYGGFDAVGLSEPNNFSIIYNVVDNSYIDPQEGLITVYNDYRNHAIFVDKDSVSAQTLQAAVSDTLIDTLGMNFIDKSTDLANKGGIEAVGDEYHTTNISAWYDAITQQVGSWLHNNDYGSVADVITGENETDINNLIAVFKGVEYPQA